MTAESDMDAHTVLVEFDDASVKLEDVVMPLDKAGFSTKSTKKQ